MNGGREALEADFQQYYGVSLESVIDGCDFGRLRALVEQLPVGSRTVSRIDPRASWSEDSYLLALIADNLAFMRYEQAGGKGRKPQQVERPKPRPKRRRSSVSVDRDTLDRLLFAPRK